MNDGSPRSGVDWWPGNAIGLDGGFLSIAFVVCTAIALAGRWMFGVGLGETLFGGLFLLMLFCTSRAFHVSINRLSESAREAVAETTGRKVPSTNPLPRAFQEPAPDATEPVSTGMRASVPIVRR